MENKRLTIAFVSDAIYPYNKGGKEKRLYEISTRLASAGHDVHIYCMKWWKSKEKHRIENGVHLHAISKLYPLYSGKRRSIREAIFFALSCLKLITAKFDVMDVDHMPHLVLFSTKLITFLKHKKLFVTWNEVWGREYWKQYLGILGNIAYLIECFSVKMPDVVISISEHTTKKLKNEFNSKKTIYTIPAGIDFEQIQKIQPSKQKSDVIFAGRLLSHKNVNLLIASIHLLKNKYPNIKCVIVGKGPEEIKLKKLVNDLNLQNNIIFYDFLEKHTDLYALMKASKVFAFPSIREGFGIAALEANAAGIPVITTNHKDNATKDLIRKGINGDIVQLDEKKIAAKVKEYLSTDQMQDEIIRIAKDYDWNTIAERIEEVYTK